MMRWILPAVFLLGCARSEYTGRRQLLLVDEKTEARLGSEAYQQILAEQKVSAEPAEVDAVRRVGRRIAQVADQPGFRWEFNVIADDQTMNAFCLPGGKIAFYTGIFPVLQDDAGMAFVMGHEIAHALLRHGAERMSQNMLAGAAGSLLDAYLGARKPEAREAVLAAFGVTVGVGVLLPFSRKHESEADQVGLDLMAKAGYDPRVSVEVWKRMARMSGGQPPEFLSTHPSHETRIADLEEGMPKALALYRGASQAPVARLPSTTGTARKDARSAAASPPVAVRTGPPRRSRLDDGRKELRLEFAFDTDVFVDTVEVRGPGGTAASIAPAVGIPAGEPRYARLVRPAREAPDFAPGRYTAVLRGSASGRPFSVTAESEVR